MTQEAIEISTTPPLPGLKLVQDVNKALQTIATDFAGPTDPAGLPGCVPYCTWADTGNMLLKRRNAANTGWVVEGRLFIDASQATNVGYDNSNSGLVAVNVQAAIDEIVSGRGRFIGEAFAIWDHLSGAEIPDNSGSAKFIKLTAGDSYNAGLLTNESVTGSAPLVVATAVISLPDSPMDGETIHLINTERRALRAGSSGTVQNDQMQRITGEIGGTASLAGGSGISGAGAFSSSTTGAGIHNGGSAGTSIRADFDSANSPDARTGDETRMKNIGATYYMRIK